MQSTKCYMVQSMLLKKNIDQLLCIKVVGMKMIFI